MHTTRPEFRAVIGRGIRRRYAPNTQRRSGGFCDTTRGVSVTRSGGVVPSTEGAYLRGIPARGGARFVTRHGVVLQADTGRYSEAAGRCFRSRRGGAFGGGTCRVSAHPRGVFPQPMGGWFWHTLGG